MRRFIDKEKIEKINTYLEKLLFEGRPEISPEDRLIFCKEESPLFGKDRPLLEPGDRLSFIQFGGPPIPDPEFTNVYEPH